LIGDRIRELRTNLGLSGKNLGDMVGITQSYISALERGEREPSLDVVKRLSLVLKTSVSYLMDDDTPIINNNRQNFPVDGVSDFVSVRVDDLDDVSKAFLILRNLIKEKSKLSPGDRNILLSIMEDGIKALSEDVQNKIEMRQTI